MKYCYIRKPVPFIQYSGINEQEVVDFITDEIFDAWLDDGVPYYADDLDRNFEVNESNYIVISDGEIVQYSPEDFHAFFKEAE